MASLRDRKPKPRRFGSPLGAQALFTLFGVCAAWCASGLLQAQNPPTDTAVKAAYLYQFGKFIEWPGASSTRAEDAFPICILGTDPFGGILGETVAERSVQGKRVIAKRIAGVGEAAACNILFIGASEQERLPEIINSLQGQSVLTVGDSQAFSGRGIMINFVIEQRRVRFEINLSAVERANLKVSSELLKVAKVIRN